MNIQLSLNNSATMYLIVASSIPVVNIKDKINYFELIIGHSNLYLSIKFPKKYNWALINKNRNISSACFSFRFHNEHCVLRYKISAQKLINNLFNDRFIINDKLKNGVLISGILNIKKEDLLKEIKQKKSKQKKKLSQRERKKLENEKRKRKYKRLLEVMEERYKNEINTTKQKNHLENDHLKQKGIYRVDSMNFRKCDNCIYFMNNKCVFHQVNVTKNHCCNKFRKFKEIYGGGFSPR